MNQQSSLCNTGIATLLSVSLLFTAGTTHENLIEIKADPVAANITAYSKVWDEIMNKGKPDDTACRAIIQLNFF